jgi:hypothetical protein
MVPTRDKCNNPTTRYTVAQYNTRKLTTNSATISPLSRLREPYSRKGRIHLLVGLVFPLPPKVVRDLEGDAERGVVTVYLSAVREIGKR